MADMEVVGTDEFEAWFDGLDDPDAKAVIRAIHQLEMAGVNLRFPLSSAINGASFALRELRVQSGGRPIRVFYAFDPARDAVLIIGGFKDGAGGKDFYGDMIGKSEAIWKQYLAERGE